MVEQCALRVATQPSFYPINFVGLQVEATGACTTRLSAHSGARLATRARFKMSLDPRPLWLVQLTIDVRAHHWDEVDTAHVIVW
jgi:hypothetical protein